MTKPVVIDFYADWCGPCKIQGPILDELKQRMGESVEIRKVDVDSNLDLAQKYDIRVVPTLIVEKNGQVIQMYEGVTTADELEHILTSLVD
jgi:thioredoxin 1